MLDPSSNNLRNSPRLLRDFAQPCWFIEYGGEGLVADDYLSLHACQLATSRHTSILRVHSSLANFCKWYSEWKGMLRAKRTSENYIKRMIIVVTPVLYFPQPQTLLRNNASRTSNSDYGNRSKRQDTWAYKAFFQWQLQNWRRGNWWLNRKALSSTWRSR